MYIYIYVHMYIYMYISRGVNYKTDAQPRHTAGINFDAIHIDTLQILAALIIGLQ